MYWQVEKKAKEYDHFYQSENTEDMLADPQVASLQESRDAQNNYTVRRRDPNQLGPKTTVMRSDFLPVSQNRNQKLVFKLR